MDNIFMGACSVWPRDPTKIRPTANTRIHVVLFDFPLEYHIDEKLKTKVEHRVAKILRQNLDKITGGKKIKYSQFAGCSCGCSPGYITDKKILDEKGNIADLYVYFHLKKKEANEIV